MMETLPQDRRASEVGSGGVLTFGLQRWPRWGRAGQRALVLLACALPALAWAAPENITEGELALLPAYCRDVQVINPNSGAKDTPSPRAAHWVGVMGQSFWAMHHYCWGLIHVRRSQVPGLPPVQRAGMLGSAINDYFFVIKNSPRDFVLAPEIYLRIGEARQMLGDVAGAREAFRTSRELKPDYWPAYTREVDLLLKTNQKAEAKTIASEGLRFAPDAKDLADRLRKLGGDPEKIIAATAASAVGNGTRPHSDSIAPESAASTAGPRVPAASSAPR